jgi:hypothetical protein
MSKRIIALTAAIFLATPAFAQDITSWVVDDSFDNVAFSVESAILDKGLTIDAVSHVGEMLERTRVDVGSEMTLYSEGVVYSFCSASVSRTAMEADIMNIAFCPYGIFVFSTPENPDQTTVGHRFMPGDSMAPVNEMLDAIILEAIEG